MTIEVKMFKTPKMNQKLLPSPFASVAIFSFNLESTAFYGGIPNPISFFKVQFSKEESIF